MLHSSPSPHFLQRQPSPIRLSYRCWISLQAVSTFTILVFYHTGICSIALKPTMHFFFFLLSDHLNQYLQLHSLVHEEPLFYGEFKTTIKITIQILIYLRDLQKYSTIPSTRSWYSKNPYIHQLRKTAPNSRSSGVGNLQLWTYTVFTFCNLTSLSPLSYCNGSQRTQKVNKQLLV